MVQAAAVRGRSAIARSQYIADGGISRGFWRGKEGIRMVPWWMQVLKMLFGLDL